ncbi:hypothetical protein, partial [Xanthomonas phaseoli]
ASRTACGDLDHRAVPLNAMPRAKLSTVAGDKPVEKWRYLSYLFGRPSSQPLVESTVSTSSTANGRRRRYATPTTLEAR